MLSPPFTPESVQEMIRSLGGRIFPLDVQQSEDSKDLRHIASHLNLIDSQYRFMQDVGNQSGPMADRVRGSIETLTMFFEERKREWQRTGNSMLPEHLEAEQSLYAHFHSFVDAMDKHSFPLALDGALLARPLEDWHDIALLIAQAFQLCMERTSGRLGVSEDGPVARFVFDAVSRMGAKPQSLGAVGQHLKREMRATQNAARLSRDN